MPACTGFNTDPDPDMESNSPYSGTLAGALTEPYQYNIDPQIGDVRARDALLQLTSEERVYTSLQPAYQQNTNNLSSSSSNNNNSSSNDNQSRDRDGSQFIDNFDFSVLNPDQQTLRRWTYSHPKSWTCEQVLDWIYYTAEQEKRVELQGENFNQMQGSKLCSLTKEDFCRLEPSFGDVLFDALQYLLEESFFTPPHVEEPCQTSPPPVYNHAPIGHVLPEISSMMSSPPVYNNFNTFANSNISSQTFPGILHPGQRANYYHTTDRSCSTAEWWSHKPRHPYQLTGEDPSLATQFRRPSLLSPEEDLTNPLSIVQDDYDESDSFSDIINITLDEGCSSGYESEGSFTSSSSSLLPDQFEQRMALGNLPNFHDLTNFEQQPPLDQTLPAHCQMMSSVAHEASAPLPPPKKKRGRPKKEVVPGSQVPHTSNRGRKHGQVTKGTHLWEFCREMLKDPEYNPRLLKWEDKSDGVFRIVKSEEVAKKWGERKKNPQMTYEKLSRALRFCRTTNYFSPVPKNGRYPKKLCFRFGSKATGWQ